MDILLHSKKEMRLTKLFQPAVRLLLLTAASQFIFQYSVAQKAGVNASEIASLIKEWNHAHNARSTEAFNTVYDKTVVLYAQQLRKAECIAQKKKFFSEHPDYKQNITSSISYDVYPSGVIRCSFKKAVTKDGVLWKYPAYLLVSYENNRYRIVGESDDASDRTLNYYLAIGKRTEPPQVVNEDLKNENEDSVAATAMKDDSAVVKASDDSVSVSEADTSSVTQPSTESIAIADPLPVPVIHEDAVTIPLPYIYMLVGFLIVSSIVIMVVAGTRSKKRSRKSKAAPDLHAGKHDHYDMAQSAIFEKFVITLFDPLYFRAFRAKREKVMADPSAEVAVYPELEFEFSHKDARISFVVESMYIPHLKYKDILIAPPDKVAAYRQLDEDDHDLYLVLGIEGKPDDPRELYLIPVIEIRQSYITYPQLQRFRKYGMFFYNTENERLQ
jgi:hypothetical protein